MASEDNLKIIVVGAGIAGLTSAYLLRKAGHDVTVLEKNGNPCELDISRDGGLRLPPNAARLLEDLPGTEKLLQEKATKCAGMHLFQCENKSSELVGKLEFKDDIMHDLGSDFYFIPHRDLHSHLYDLCKKVGVQLRHHFEVKQVRNDKDTNPLVISEGGEHVVGDIVIGADGKNSIVRDMLLVEEDDTAENDFLDDTHTADRPAALPMKMFTGATTSISVSLIESDPELSELTNSAHWKVWMGNGISVMGARYGPDLYILDLIYGTPRCPEDTDDDWLSGKPVQSVLKHLDDFDTRVKKILQLASTSHWNIQTVHDLPQYVSKHDNVVAIGDGRGNAIGISGTHNTAAAFEDAFTLGRLFSHKTSIRSRKSLLLNGYQNIRQERARNIELVDMSTAVLMGSHPGPEREARNNGLRKTLELEDADDDTLAKAWAPHVAQFDYDARDAVDEWWMTWARPASRIIS